MSSSTEICNLALGHVGVSKSIANVETENSTEANSCRRFYDLAVSFLQRDFPYAVHTVEAALGLVQEDPNTEYQYEYQYPSDCQKINFLLSGQRNDTRQSRPHYKLTSGTTGTLLWTDIQDACMDYQVIETDTGRFNADFVLTLSYKLAELIAPTVTGGDPFGLGGRSKANYEEVKSTTMANSINEEQDEEHPEAEFIRAREGDISKAHEQDWTSQPINYRVS